MFHLDVAKVDLDIPYVAMAIHACFKCFICFSRMLQVFQLYVSKVDLGEHMLQWPGGWGTSACHSRLLLLLRGAIVGHRAGA